MSIKNKARVCVLIFGPGALQSIGGILLDAGFRARIRCQNWGLDFEILRFRAPCPN